MVSQIDYADPALWESKTRVEQINSEFEAVHQEILSLMNAVGENEIWEDKALPGNLGPHASSVLCTSESYRPGLTLLIQIGATIEQTFNAITSNFWDRPIEWTTDEVLESTLQLTEYLEDTARLRRHAFEHISDSDLQKLLYDPNFKAVAILDLLIQALQRVSRDRDALKKLLDNPEAIV
ncbi:MAG: hypothetical protein ACREDR_23485 [Blastocatellia bacterium]